MSLEWELALVAHYGDMTLGRKDEEGVRAFYREIPCGGGRQNTIGPVALREMLGIGVRDFERRKNKLQDHGLIATVQGGGIYRLPREDQSETFYYEPIRRELELYWAEQPKREYHHRQRFLRVLDTHHGGRRADGQWARPDITILGGKVLPYLPGKFLDVITFEVKLGMPLQGLYEALAHRRRANFAYLMCIYPEVWGLPDPEEQATVVAEATRQGIGVILIRQEDDFELWSELVEPIRHETDPQLLHDFLETLSNQGDCLSELRSWLERESWVLPPMTDSQLQRLAFTTRELEVARKMVEMIAGSDEGWGLSNFKELGSDGVVRRVRDVLKEAGFIHTVQGGAIRRVQDIPS